MSLKICCLEIQIDFIFYEFLFFCFVLRSAHGFDVVHPANDGPNDWLCHCGRCHSTTPTRMASWFCHCHCHWYIVIAIAIAIAIAV